ncbi:MAG: type II CRISPR RNA-guided endonuclease Cas9, partial [Oscillospiraceae bacterium]|nr:type II CRISPR RNA-guided endonuclease Cas9 [Oscillospiraceae bacterium]
MKNAKKYYIGIDMGTNSVGYAVTYDDYTLVKYKGEPMWGSTVFEEAMLCDKRRTFRSDRRRLNRRQQRVQLIRDIFAKEISKVDPDFYTRIQQSNLFREDKDNPERYNVFFNDKDYKDSDFYKKYPTIHHLIDELMHSEEPHDVRLVYIACAWLVAHRGHFLNEVSKENISDIIDFAPVYKRFTDYFIQNAIELPWECSAGEFAKILKKKLPITAKEKEFEEQLFGGKKPKDTADGEYPYNRSLIIKLLSGGEVKLSKLFLKNESGESSSLNLGMSDENIASVIAEFDTDADFILILKAMYDWAVLADILNGEECISRAKIKVYNRHDEDLKNLKDFVKEYIPEKYNEIFWEISPKLNNYVFYTDYIKKGEAYKGKREKSDGNDNEKTKKKKTKKEKFYEYLKKVLKTAETAKFTDEGVKLYNDIIEKITLGTFLPKQVDNDNRVIPYQLYWYELNEILKKAEKYLPFISEKDSDGISAKEKILSVFEFRIPYFIGPLSSKNSQFAWMERKADGMIYPWNIEDKVDFDKSEKEFISRMTNTCTYIPGENVLPKNSLLYVRYEILNTINNIKINGQPVSVEAKQKIFEELILKNPRISPKKLKNYLISEGLMTEDDVIGGIDTELTVIASAKTYFDFKNLINNGILTAEDAEKIIEHRTYSEDRLRFKRWVDKEFPDLPEKEKKYIYTMKYKGFGRLSEKLLRGIKGTYKKTEERGTIMDFLWNTNDNLMQILSDNYTFGEEIEKLKKEYYSLNNPSLNDILKNMYISNSVKRPIFRTLDIVKDIISVMGYEPEKIFIEAARGGSEEQKNKRTKSRKQQIKELYSKFNKKKDNPYAEEVRELSRQLEKLGDTADNKLQSDALFLYFMQLGRCMYSGEAIDFENSIYNIEHIYPQSRVKDDSILNNKVLTLSKYNGEKGDIYPINSEWQNKMKDFWSMLYENKFITAEKY